MPSLSDLEWCADLIVQLIVGRPNYEFFVMVEPQNTSSLHINKIMEIRMADFVCY